YKVRVGDFRTRLEAEGFLQQILTEYPGAFVIKDMIRFPPLGGTGVSIQP
ncbi:MAG TPA: SPOR domain-containing protein, partial [Bacteroidales bacterium]|nr:SPOR domain-containing protein [Bacteroidales bacterium]